MICNTRRDARGVSKPCPKGNFCPQGSTAPTKCPAGTFNGVTGLQEESQCSLCPPGKFCGDKGLIEPSGKCATGFYCQAGATEEQQDAEIWPEGSGKCPPGHYCPAGKVSTARKAPLRPPPFRKQRGICARKAITVRKGLPSPRHVPSAHLAFTKDPANARHVQLDTHVVLEPCNLMPAQPATTVSLAMSPSLVQGEQDQPPQVFPRKASALTVARDKLVMGRVLWAHVPRDTCASPALGLRRPLSSGKICIRKLPFKSGVPAQ
ncbi:hypothetical protein, conserved [Eimeria brunetti]|uniref:Uncharacterized protein n=1 Tax=Eimeria brunetti TaxID=51314 RepID=U6LI31_9EIME|nr:hypothetical protein, conserved [Eimeria brunetti]